MNENTCVCAYTAKNLSADAPASRRLCARAVYTGSSDTRSRADEQCDENSRLASREKRRLDVRKIAIGNLYELCVQHLVAKRCAHMKSCAYKREVCDKHRHADVSRRESVCMCARGHILADVRGCADVCKCARHALNLFPGWRARASRYAHFVLRPLQTEPR